MVQPTIIILYLLSPPLYWSLSHNVDNIMQRLVEIQHSLNLIIPGVINMSIQITNNLLFSSMKIGQRQWSHFVELSFWLAEWCQLTNVFNKKLQNRIKTLCSFSFTFFLISCWFKLKRNCSSLKLSNAYNSNARD